MRLPCWINLITKRVQAISIIMQFIPKNRREWENFGLLPFRAYPGIGFVLLMISRSLPHPFHGGSTDAEALLVELFLGDAVILMTLAFAFLLSGFKNLAGTTLAFGISAFFLYWLFMPLLAHS
jgi:hypothetical protein